MLRITCPECGVTATVETYGDPANGFEFIDDGNMFDTYYVCDKQTSEPDLSKGEHEPGEEIWVEDVSGRL